MTNIYVGLRRKFGKDDEGLRRCAERLTALRAALATVRNERSDNSLLFDTWNIRDLDYSKFGFRPRRVGSLC